MPNPELEGIVEQITASLTKVGGEMLVQAIYAVPLDRHPRKITDVRGNGP